MSWRSISSFSAARPWRVAKYAACPGGQTSDRTADCKIVAVFDYYENEYSEVEQQWDRGDSYELHGRELAPPQGVVACPLAEKKGCKNSVVFKRFNFVD